MRNISLTFLLILLFVLGSSAQTNDAPKIKTIKAPTPVFPVEANNIIYGDAVDVHIIVGTTGRVTQAVAYGPLVPCSNFEDKTAKLIAETAVEAAKSTIFEPILKDGKPVEMALKTTYKLPISDPPAREKPGSHRKTLYLAMPEYRASAKAQNIQGEVKILVLIDEQGNVLSVGPLSGHPELIAGSIRPSCKARFDKNPTKGIGIVTYRFVR